jgi:hypothetical protein
MSALFQPTLSRYQLLPEPFSNLATPSRFGPTSELARNSRLLEVAQSHQESRIERLKRERLPEVGREERVAVSLAALRQPPAFPNLSRAEIIAIATDPALEEQD